MQKQGDTMAEVTYRPAHVKGEVRIPPSKSAAHRALLSAALCKTPCRVGPIDHSADMEATLNGVCAMGGTVKAEENGVLCIAPGTIVVYERNDVTNAVLEGKGLKLIVVPSAELPRFRRPRHRSDVCRSRQTSRAPYRRLHRPSAAARRNGRDCRRSAVSHHGQASKRRFPRAGQHQLAVYNRFIIRFATAQKGFHRYADHPARIQRLYRFDDRGARGLRC